MPRYLASATAVCLSLCSVTSIFGDDTMIKVKVGDPFPSVPLAASSIDKAKPGAQTVSIDDFKGKIVVVFFYPRADTPGCTVESCGFRDLAAEFPKDVVVLGASNDSVEKQEAFTKKHNLQHALLADVESKLIKQLGILAPTGKAAQRVTFVIGKDGKILKIYGVGSKIDTKNHPKEVLEFVKSLQAS